MKWKLGKLGVSVKLTKGKYCSCLNPHIGVWWGDWVEGKRSQRFLVFKEHWIFNIEWSRERRQQRDRLLKLKYPTIRQVFKVNLRPLCLVQMFKRTERYILYYQFLNYHTRERVFRR